MIDRSVSRLVLGAFDDVWERQRRRLDGLTDDEYRWEPVPGCWTVAREAGEWRAHERIWPEPDPPPVTTIAWRTWHIGSDCLASYTSRGLGPWPLDVEDNAWYGTAREALDALDRAWDAFRRGIVARGDDGLWSLLGDQWGPYAEEPWAALALHALDEIAHHGAEIGLLRDLYAHR